MNRRVLASILVALVAVAALAWGALVLQGKTGDGTVTGSLVADTQAVSAESPATPVGEPIVTPVPPVAVVAPTKAATIERTNILILGLDQRETEPGQASRSDTMIVVSVDHTNRKAGILSIPRDLYVEIPVCGQGGGGTLPNKITAANFWGDYWKCSGGGPELAAQTVESNLGIDIDYYVSVDFTAFENAIDALGGITVDVPQPLYDNAYPLEGDKTITVYFEAGEQHMNGTRALQYARTRHPDSDFGRIKRQQQVMLAVRDRMLDPTNWPRLPALARSLYGSIRTNIPLTDILGLANVARTIEPDDILVRTIEPSMVTGEVLSDGAEVLMPRWREIRPVIEEVCGNSSIR